MLWPVHLHSARSFSLRQCCGSLAQLTDCVADLSITWRGDLKQGVLITAVRGGLSLTDLHLYIFVRFSGRRRCLWTDVKKNIWREKAIISGCYAKNPWLEHLFKGSGLQMRPVTSPISCAWFMSCLIAVQAECASEQSQKIYPNSPSPPTKHFHASSKI